MIYIFEGGEKIGKTTLINEINKRTQIPIIKMPSAKEHFDKQNILNALSKNYDLLVEQLANSNCDFLIDRAFFTGVIYHNVYHRTNDISYIYKILNRIKDKVKLIFLYGDIITIKTRKKDEIIKLRDYNKIQQEYISFVMSEQNPLKTLTLDTTRLSLRECVNEIVAFMKNGEK